MSQRDLPDTPESFHLLADPVRDGFGGSKVQERKGLVEICWLEHQSLAQRLNSASNRHVRVQSFVVGKEDLIIENQRVAPTTCR